MDEFLIYAPFSCKGESIVSPRYRWRSWARGKEPFVIIQWTRSGCGEFLYRGKTIPVPAAHAFICIVPERSQYRYPPSAGEPWDFSWINFYGKGSIRLWKKFRDLFGAVVPLSPDTTAGLCLHHLISSVAGGTTRDRFRHSAECYEFFAEWAHDLSRGGVDRYDPIANAIVSIRTRFRTPLGVKQLASEAGMTREHFSRLFATRTGIPPARYLRDLRLAAASELQRDTDLAASEVAMRCGFSSPLQLRRARQTAAIGGRSAPG